MEDKLENLVNYMNSGGIDMNSVLYELLGLDIIRYPFYIKESYRDLELTIDLYNNNISANLPYINIFSIFRSNALKIKDLKEKDIDTLEIISVLLDDEMTYTNYCCAISYLDDFFELYMRIILNFVHCWGYDSEVNNWIVNKDLFIKIDEIFLLLGNLFTLNDKEEFRKINNKLLLYLGNIKIIKSISDDIISKSERNLFYPKKLEFFETLYKLRRSLYDF